MNKLLDRLFWLDDGICEIDEKINIAKRCAEKIITKIKLSKDDKEKMTKIIKKYLGHKQLTRNVIADAYELLIIRKTMLITNGAEL